MVQPQEEEEGSRVGRGDFVAAGNQKINDFSIGICTSDSAPNIRNLIRVIAGETLPEGFAMQRMIIVASGCEPSTVQFLRNLSETDNRIVLIEEPLRRGKAAAINKILSCSLGDFLILVNGDALPAGGAIGKLLVAITRDDRVGMVAARPVFESRGGWISNVLELMWTAHSDCSQRLNHKSISNQCSDELMVARKEVVQELPGGIVNDGAYLAGIAYSRGYRIKFCPEATVRIDVPNSFTDLMSQRRRIIFGHLQVWKLLGKPPRTVETLLLTSPLTGLKLVIGTLAGVPRLILGLPLAFMVEILSISGAAFDTLRSTRKHAVWERYGS